MIPNAQKPSNRWEKNRQHWSRTLDAQNLADESQGTSIHTQTELFLTADVTVALREMRPLEGRMTLDLGGGLGLMAILLARRGAHVVIADISLPRLQKARALAVEQGFGDRIHCVYSAAEALPFVPAAFDRITCKSVLIHTRLKLATDELARILSGDGVACLIEPMAGNPFVNLYRRLAAPSVWKEITDYFDTSAVRTVSTSFRDAGFRTNTRFMYWLSFFATPLNYTLHWPHAYRIAERLLLGVDAIALMLLPGLRRQCWFSVIKVFPRR
ncbi:class I SAM-dependent methyltransferase [Candidatus Sumerlaeota bacterium]|nr:class I SAM-dependent methyltransferase [Candidatus Sumerlaeota bacterium]